MQDIQYSAAEGFVVPQQIIARMSRALAIGGWLGSSLISVPDIEGCWNAIPIGRQLVPILLVPLESVLPWEQAARLALVERQACSMLYAEVCIVITGAAPGILEVFAERCRGIADRRIWAGDLEGFEAWAKARLGPLAAFPPEDPVRRVAESMLEVSYKEAPVRMISQGTSNASSCIASSFSLGQQGEEALLTLFTHLRGHQNVLDISGDPVWQKRGVDMLLLDGKRSPLKLEVKTESYANGRIALEMVGNVGRQSPGWMVYSQADVLATVLAKTGDVYLMNFPALQKWVRENTHSMTLRKGYAPGQSYYSHIHAVELRALFGILPSMVHFNLYDWLGPLLPAAHSARMTIPGQEKNSLPARKPLVDKKIQFT